MDLHPGMTAEKSILVEAAHSAAQLGSGNVEVYATPSMVLHMEETALEAVDPHVGPGKATVGAFIGVKHLAPTPLGMKVRIRAELVKVEGRTLGFLVHRGVSEKIAKRSIRGRDRPGRFPSSSTRRSLKRCKRRAA
jgi:predicted thioesterase